MAMDLILHKAGGASGWRRVAVAFLLALVFLAVFIPVQWFFSKFLLSPHANNWFFVGNRVWDYGSRLGDWTTHFWRVNPTDPQASLLTSRAVAVSVALAAFSSWLGLLLGGWMRKVQR
jgi:hypothetical protein